MPYSFATPWTVACQDSQSMEFSRQEYWSGLPFPSPGNLPDPAMEPMFPALADRFFTTEPPGKSITGTSRTHSLTYCLTLFRLPWWLRRSSVCLQCCRPRFNPWVGKISWRRKWHPTPIFLPGKSHRRRSLLGYSPWRRKESDTTEQLHFHFYAFQAIAEL